MSPRKAGKWTTQQGETLDVAWMDSVHLVHCVNLVSRRAGNALISKQRWYTSAVFEEAQRRSLLGNLAIYPPAGTQFPAPNRRESPAELCMLNALIEHGMYSEVPALRANPTQVFECIQKNHPTVWTTYTKHRLTR